MSISDLTTKLIIHLPCQEVDKDVQEMADKMAASKVFNRIRLMPDCHVGSNCCVGMTDVLIDKVIPQIVGGDIGCGIAMIPLDRKIKEKHFEKIDTMIKQRIPMGAANHSERSVHESVLDEVFERCNKMREALQHRFPKCNLETLVYDENYYKDLKSRISPHSVRTDYLTSMGTLGGGNHYIEFNVDEETDAHFLTVHCGSRHLGQAICNFHQANILPSDKNFLDRYLEGDAMVQYCIDMVFAQEFARKNRRVILQVICDEIGSIFDDAAVIESVHNYIDFERFILRKGAISAEDGEQCLIALNMRDGILLCRGKGNEAWNFSSAHGCGRLMSRRDARASFTMRQYKETMKGVYSTSIHAETLDEIPQAYKDSKHIQGLVAPSVEILKHLKPILNIKGF